MRLVTRCPACATTFKVVRDQLRISEGWVRCGRCSNVFDATQALWETNDDGTPAKALTPPSAQAAGAPPTAAPPGPAALPASARHDVDDDDGFDLGPDLPGLPRMPGGAALAPMSWPNADMLELGARPPALPTSPSAGAIAATLSSANAGMPSRFGAHAVEPRFDALPSLDLGLPTAPAETAGGRREPAFALPLTSPSAGPSPVEAAVNAQLQKALRRERVKALRRERAEQRDRDREAEAQSAGDPIFDAPDEDTQPGSAAEASPASQAGALLATASDEPAPQPDMWTEPPPSFVGATGTTDTPPRRRAGRWLWTLGCLAALALLALQYLVHERDFLVAREPRLRPALQSLCDFAGCQLQPPRMISAITIDGASFSREREDGYRLTFSLRNSSRVALAMPAVELTLLDTQERALVRRVFLPAEFGALGVLAASGERSVSLPVRLAGPESAGLPAVAGYRLVAFYP